MIRLVKNISATLAGKGKLPNRREYFYNKVQNNILRTNRLKDIKLFCLYRNKVIRLSAAGYSFSLFLFARTDIPVIRQISRVSVVLKCQYIC